jgi:hypothetical protein
MLTDNDNEETTICQLYYINLIELNKCLNTIKIFKNEIKKIESYTEEEMIQLYELTRNPNCKKTIELAIEFSEEKLKRIIEYDKGYKKILMELCNTCKIISQKDMLLEIQFILNNLLNDSEEKAFKVNINDIKKHLNLIKFRIKIYRSIIENNMTFGNKYKNHPCCICYNTFDFIIETHCRHYFCEECLYKSISIFYNDRFILKNEDIKPKCPMCRTMF